MRPLLNKGWHRFQHFFEREIWKAGHMADRSPRGCLYAVLRVVSISATVFNETKAASRAAALSFSSVLGLAPLIAIAVLIGGFMLGEQEDSQLIADKLIQILKAVAPQLEQLESIQQATPAADGAQAAAEGAAGASLVSMVNGIIAGARSGSAAGIGILSLILIVLLLFKSIEDAFNDIWGVRDARKWITRLVHYWTILTLGAVLFIAVVTLMGAGAFVTVFREIPFGGQLLGALTLLRWALPAGSFALLVGMLTLCYRVIPNTRVLWRAAFCGALLVSAMLMLNNYVALIYLKRVSVELSLYGSLSFLPVLTLGLYLFWFYVLTGAVISYAVQNVHFRNSQAAWSRLSESMRERLSLVVFITICRRFQACLPPVSSLHLSTMMKVPTQILNESLNRLVDVNLIAIVPPPAEADSGVDVCYQPARPLSRMTLFDFKTLEENFGDDPTGDALERLDPLITRYNAARARLGEDPIFSTPIEDLLEEHPFDASRAPFETLSPR